MVLFIFGVPALFRHQSLVRTPFDETPVKLLNQLKPDCVLLGDSMLGSRIDAETLKQVSDIPCAILAYPGTATAQWFLLLKNAIAARPHPPRWTIVFFRDRQLTMPTHRTGNRYRNGLEMCMRDDEPQFNSILHRAEDDSTRWTERAASALYLIQRKRKDWQENMLSGALKTVTRRAERNDVRAAAARIFSSKNGRADQNILDARDGEESLNIVGHEFRANVEKSFLPPILEIARASHTRLIFFRVKRRPDPGTSAIVDRPDLQKYQEELRAYLEGHEALLVDETADPKVTFDYYSSDDHLRYEMMAPYTKQFWKEVKPLLGSAAPAE